MIDPAPASTEEPAWVWPSPAAWWRPTAVRSGSRRVRGEGSSSVCLGRPGRRLRPGTPGRGRASNVCEEIPRVAGDAGGPRRLRHRGGPAPRQPDLLDAPRTGNLVCIGERRPLRGGSGLSRLESRPVRVCVRSSRSRAALLGSVRRPRTGDHTVDHRPRPGCRTTGRGSRAAREAARRAGSTSHRVAVGHPPR